MNPFRLLSLTSLLSGVAFTGQAQTCPPVTNLTTTMLSSRSVSVNATPATGATSYVIVCTIFPSSASLGLLFNSVIVNTPTYTFTNLPVGTAYTICVNTVCGAGQQQGSACSPREVLTTTRNAALAEQVALVPNPATGHVALTLPAALRVAGTRATLVNALGQVVRQHTLAAGPTVELDLTSLAPGVYSLKLQAGAEWVTKRLVVQ
jgi:hypothetical protein